MILVGRGADVIGIDRLGGPLLGRGARAVVTRGGGAARPVDVRRTSGRATSSTLP
ncbi:hypothetical protein [Streptomyces sp. NPDC059460]|uniref:hypothetical protein n=1 Tax=Streptomyces sp. NPDC059460 TaxID=3346840 RepID=UPI0036AF6B65